MDKMNPNQAPRNIDEYIAQFPPGIQDLLHQLRSTIRAAAPEAKEVISYKMPGFRYKGMLVWFAMFRKHIGFFPTNSGVTAFEDQLSAFRYSKGAIQFPLDKPLPLDLVTKIVRFRVDENIRNENLKH